MTDTQPHANESVDELPRWSASDLHESFEARSFLDSMERMEADVRRLDALFDEHGIRAIDSRPPNADDVAACESAISAYNATADEIELLVAYVYEGFWTASLDVIGDRIDQYEQLAGAILEAT